MLIADLMNTIEIQRIAVYCPLGKVDARTRNARILRQLRELRQGLHIEIIEIPGATA